VLFANRYLGSSSAMITSQISPPAPLPCLDKHLFTRGNWLFILQNYNYYVQSLEKLALYDACRGIHAYLQQLVAERSFRNNGAMLAQLSSGLECATSLERVAAAVMRALVANSLDLSKTISA